MDNRNSFLSFLKDGIGLTNKPQRDAIVNHGFDTCQGLVDTTEDGIKEVFNVISQENRNTTAANKVFIKEQVKQRFYGARAEFLMRQECGASIPNAYITAIDTNDLDIFVRKHNNWKEYKRAAANMSLPDVTVPKLVKNN